MNNFHDIYLPEFVAVHTISKICFTNHVVSSVSGREQRRNIRSLPFNEYVIKDCRMQPEEYEELNGFFRARKGRMFSFKLRDISDHILAEHVIAYGDGSSSSFIIQKHYKDAYAPSVRQIIAPVASELSVKVDSEEVEWIFNEQTRQIELRRTPRAGSVITASGFYDIVVRFDSDHLEVSYADDGTILLDDCKLVEVISAVVL